MKTLVCIVIVISGLVQAGASPVGFDSEDMEIHDANNFPDRDRLTTHYFFRLCL